jgi:hypothetical protein
MIQRITTREQLIELHQRLQLRDDWHEPDEREVSARVRGGSFDNAGYWGTEMITQTFNGVTVKHSVRSMEMWVTVTVNGQPTAEVNLATLFAFACGTYDGE